MMQQELDHFIQERAQHLAIVYLTRSPDLVIERMPAEYGIDLLVTLLSDRSPTGRMFGIQIKSQDKAFKNVLRPHPNPSP
jgi:Domain of unknown function (DUF4365)